MKIFVSPRYIWWRCTIWILMKPQFKPSSRNWKNLLI